MQDLAGCAGLMRRRAPRVLRARPPSWPSRYR